MPTRDEVGLASVVLVIDTTRTCSIPLVASAQSPRLMSSSTTAWDGWASTAFTAGASPLARALASLMVARASERSAGACVSPNFTRASDLASAQTAVMSTGLGTPTCAGGGGGGGGGGFFFFSHPATPSISTHAARVARTKLRFVGLVMACHFQSSIDPPHQARQRNAGSQFVVLTFCMLGQILAGLGPPHRIGELGHQGGPDAVHYGTAGAGACCRMGLGRYIRDHRAPGLPDCGFRQGLAEPLSGRRHQSEDRRVGKAG